MNMGPDHLRAVSDHMMAGATDAEKYLLQELINYLADSKLRNEMLNRKIDDGFARVEAHCSNRTAGCNGVMQTMQERLTTLERTDAVDAAVRQKIEEATDIRMEQLAQMAVDKYFTRVKTAQAVGVVSLISTVIIGLAQWLISMFKP